MHLELIENNDIKMSSREIAKLCDKRHSDVRRDIRNMLNSLEIDVIEFTHTYQDRQNKKLEEYLLPKDLTFTLVSGYNVKLRKKIIDRWLELESDSVEPEIMLLKQAQMLVNMKRQQKQQEVRLQLVENKVDTLNPTTGYRTITGHCRILGINIPHEKANAYGRTATGICRARGIDIGSIPDERYGRVNSYPIKILEEVFSKSLSWQLS